MTETSFGDIETAKKILCDYNLPPEKKQIKGVSLDIFHDDRPLGNTTIVLKGATGTVGAGMQNLFTQDFHIPPLDFHYDPIDGNGGTHTFEIHTEDFNKHIAPFISRDMDKTKKAHIVAAENCLKRQYGTFVKPIDGNTVRITVENVTEDVRQGLMALLTSKNMDVLNPPETRTNGFGTNAILDVHTSQYNLYLAALTNKGIVN